MLLELYPVWLALVLWGPSLNGVVLMVHTDNIALVHVLNTRCSKLHLANAILREISLLSMHYNFVLVARHIRGEDNYLADSLSRLQVGWFIKQSGGDHRQRIVVPENLQPRSFKAMLQNF